MNDPEHALAAQFALPEGLVGLFTPERTEPGRPLPFACRPLTARSTERHSVIAFFQNGIGLQCIDQFKSSLHDLLTQETAKIFLDFSSATLSRTALGTLMAFAAAVHGNNKRLYLYRPSAQLRSELKKVGLSDFFQVLDHEDDIVASLVM
ncbi:hypothetical protein LJC15_02110 [Desulfovibrio sp. OttesenSCG-928-G11]|nr:hypothetical protein [Desulfovibrio sp. OttesenSCG-928-G11]